MQGESSSTRFTFENRDSVSKSTTIQLAHDEQEQEHQPLNENQPSGYYTFASENSMLHHPEIDPRTLIFDPSTLAASNVQYNGSETSTDMKLGTFRGVILPTCEFMWSVLIFIRFGWIVGSLGIGVTWALISLCALNVAITMSSLSAITTNGIPRGNAVNMLTKSLGSGLGGAIALMYYLGLATFTAIEVIGSVQGLQISTNLTLTGNMYWDQVIIAILSVVFILFIPSMIGSRVVLRLSIFFMIALSIAFLSIIAGLVAAPSVNDYGGEVTGISRETFFENFGPPELDKFKLREALVLMVPCFIGIFTGVNQAANLKNPLVSIPVGGFGAISISTILYLCLTGLIGSCIHRKLLLENFTVVPGIAWPDPLFAKIGLYLVGQGSGLHSVVIGARVLQSLAAEEIVPWLKTWKLDVNGQDIPRPALIITTLLAISCLFLPDLESIATVVTMIFLLCYGLTNFACFLLSVFHQPNWRPHFRYYHSLLSLAGSALAVTLMFQIHSAVAALAILALLLIAWWIQLHGITTWGYGIHGLLFHLVLTHLTQAERDEFYESVRKIEIASTDHPTHSLASHPITIGGPRLSAQAGTVHLTTWRPHILSFVPVQPRMRKGLLSIVAQLKTKSQLCVLADLVTSEEVDLAVTTRAERGGITIVAGVGPFGRQEVVDEMVVRRKTLLQKEMEEEEIQGFVKVVTCASIRIGQSILMQSVGLGELAPNTVIHAWPSPTKDPERNVERIRELQELWMLTRRQGLSTILCKGLISFPGIHERMRGCLDIWWIGRDGQLLLLITTLLHQHPTYQETRVRLFTIARANDDPEELEKRIRVHLNLMRIKVDEVKSVPIQFPENGDGTEECPFPVTHLHSTEKLTEDALTYELEAETLVQRTFHRGDERLLKEFQTIWTPGKVRKHPLFESASVTAQLKREITQWSGMSDMVLLNLPAPDVDAQVLEDPAKRAGLYMELFQYLTENIKQSLLIHVGEKTNKMLSPYIL